MVCELEYMNMCPPSYRVCYATETEFFIIGSKQQLLKTNPSSIRVGFTDIKPVSEVRNLGSWFDSNFSMSTHICKSCDAAFYWLHNIKRISRFIGKEKLEMLLLQVEFTAAMDCSMDYQIVKLLNYRKCKTLRQGY